MIIENNSKIKIIGDSLAAGVGSSNIEKTDKVLFKDRLKKYQKIKTTSSWSNLLEKYLSKNNCTIINNGAVGATSNQINKYIKELVDKGDDVVIVLVGINDRKRKNGLEELNKNLPSIIKKLKDMHKQIIVLTPTPSTKENEFYKNRIYHTPQIVDIIRNVCMLENVLLIDLYAKLNNYLKINYLKLEDVIYGENCKNDGFHPSDTVQKLIYEFIKEEIKIK